MYMKHRFWIHNSQIQLTHLTNWLEANVGALVAEGQTHAWGHGWQARRVLEPKDGIWCFCVKLGSDIPPELITQFVITWS
jgi:hypothetical protein